MKQTFLGCCPCLFKFSAATYIPRLYLLIRGKRRSQHGSSLCKKAAERCEVTYSTPASEML